MVGVTWDVEIEEGEYMAKGINFITSCQRMIYSTYWASDIEIQNI